MKDYEIESKKRQETMGELAWEAKNNDIRNGACKCPGTFAHLLEDWMNGSDTRDYQGDWHNYNGIDVFTVRFKSRFAEFKKNFFKTKFAKVNVRGEVKTLEIPEDPAFYTYAHRIMSDVEEHDITIKQFTDGRMPNMRPPLKVSHFIDVDKKT